MKVKELGIFGVLLTVFGENFDSAQLSYMFIGAGVVLTIISAFKEMKELKK